MGPGSKYLVSKSMFDGEMMVSSLISGCAEAKSRSEEDLVIVEVKLVLKKDQTLGSEVQKACFAILTALEKSAPGEWIRQSQMPSSFYKGFDPATRNAAMDMLVESGKVERSKRKTSARGRHTTFVRVSQ